MAESSKRSYDATKRRERAEAERRATRRRVVAAAQRLFVEQGYIATTMADIASAAGVAMQSVYKAGKSKPELLQRVVDVIVAGDDEHVLLTDRPNFAAISAEPEAARQVEMVAALIASTQERSASVQVALREAAAVDETVARYLDAELARRHETIGAIVGLIAEDRLRFSREESADTVWAIGSSEVFLLLRKRRGWEAERYLRWLTRTLTEQLLVPATPRR